MAGPRYPDYFPNLRKDSVFNNKKYKRYFLYLNAKGNFVIGNVRTAKQRKTENYTETCTSQSPVPKQVHLAKLDIRIW